ncbi:MBL fold metallo-hydrolase [Aquirufa sp. ROCK2-A2]
MIQLKTFCFNPFQENTYLLWDSTGIGVIVDPGCYTYEERLELKNFISEQQIELKAILNTHAHIDHVLGVEFIKKEFNIPFYLHPKEVVILNDAANRAQVYGFPHYQAADVDVWYTDNEILNFGEMNIQVLFVPGHAPGHVALYLQNESKLIAGDVLFRRSVGRTDFPMCNHNDLMNSIRTQLYTLADETEVFPGHGGKTSIGEEKIHNPFIKG